MDVIILLPILIPLLAGVILYFVKKLTTAKALGIYSAVVAALALFAMLFAGNMGDLSLRIINMFDGLSVYFHIDGMSKLFGVLGAGLWCLTAIYSIAYFKGEQRLRRYFLFYQFALGVIMALCLAGNIITFYLCFEMMTLLTFPFVLQEQTKEAVFGAFKYLLFSVCGAMTALAGIFFLCRYTKGMDFAVGGIIDDKAALGHQQLILVAVMLTIVGFGAKAGMFPLHAWLPVAHPVAPAPASAILSGFIAKCGVLAIVRMVFYVAGPGWIQGTWVQYTWMILSLMTVFMGSMLAYREKVLKKRLAYSTVSQISYILFGLSLLNDFGVTGGLLHVVYHACVKVVLFLFAGVVIHQTGKTKVADLDGLGKRMPITYVCFTLVSVTLVGIPPTSAFMSKLYLCIGALQTGMPAVYYMGIAILLISALLTAGYLLSITVKGFYYEEKPVAEETLHEDGTAKLLEETLHEEGTVKVSEKNRSLEPGACMLVPMILLTILAVGLGLFTKPLMDYIVPLAAELL